MSGISRFSFHEQWSHVYVELGRARNSYENHDIEHMKLALIRVLNMLDDMTEDHVVKKKNIYELLRFRDYIAEWYVEQHHSSTTLDDLERYCHPHLNVARAHY